MNINPPKARPASSGITASAGDQGIRAAETGFALRSVQRTAVHGVLWTSLSFAGSKLFLFVSTVILARLLLPAQFGQVAFALLVIAYIEAVGDFGVSSALIVEREKPQEAANIAFLVSIVTGVLWFAVCYLAAPIIADFFHDPAVIPLMRVMATLFIINSLGNTHDALLRRALAFRKRVVPDFALALLKGGCSVLLAVLGWAAWSLVWGQVLGAAAATMALWVLMPWRPSLRVSWPTTRRMLRYGSHIIAVNVLAAIVYNADFAIIGRKFGTSALGLYSLAYRTPEFFVTMLTWVVGKVCFPAYSALRDDPDALRSAFLTTLRYLSLLTLPAGICLALVGQLFVLVFYGEQWMPAASSLQVLAIAGAVRSLGSHAGDVYKATGRPAILAKLGLLRAAVIVPAMLWGARFGIFGVAMAQLVVGTLSTLLNLYVAGRVLGIPLGAILRQFRSAVIACAAMAMAVFATLSWLGHMPAGTTLAAALVVGGGVYLGVLLVTDRETVREVLAVLASLGGRARFTPRARP